MPVQFPIYLKGPINGCSWEQLLINYFFKKIDIILIENIKSDQNN